MAHWHDFNPWASRLVYVPSLEELAECVIDGQANLRRWKAIGPKLDAYILPQLDDHHSIGIRYGREGHEYLSPHNAHPTKTQALLDKYRSPTPPSASSPSPAPEPCPMIWQPIESAPENQPVLLWQPGVRHLDEGMIIGSIERKGYEHHDPPFWVNPHMVSGYEWECDLTRPTHWAPLPPSPEPCPHDL
jgi:hypothetical protein